ncbi:MULTISPECIES: FGGY family carbohydrate kinase [unclassified Rhizobium]|jgi:sugar (pentulose or hexulose) kinase|uniref:FGGY-family carbohydrate kinase n=1 Tax=unclassified Rhizobium TaxID=2613769 RepID=UPI000647AE8D|nr:MULTISPECIES: FGGY family carbohydrate kinase [unclassified Rhizobium]MBN8950544.1 carbohydrate kinase [Rhizobium tropici]OJY66102.1 MAG: carbohydrate kinase [Rhizobium sp. 60-20]RKD69358.1 sugar (pentulose or hexulose) kinase [Rhizobium sp. WW_1]
MSIVAVFDIGKTNVKLSAASDDGHVLETLSTPNIVKDGPPYRHHDLVELEAWLIDSLTELGKRHDIGAIVSCAHGSGGVLVDGRGAAMPMIDYEQPIPSDVDARYRSVVGSYRERASAIMLGAAHLARQMLWQEMHWPETFASAHAYLATPQYWAFRLSGVLASEVTSLAAQSHLWASADGRPAALVANRGWQRLMPPMRRAWETLGPLKPELARQCGLKTTTRILCGVHDSSANLYRYQAADLSDFTVVSTGTWIVALTDRNGVDFSDEQPGHSCNADVFGNPTPGMLTMGGREFAAVASKASGPASLSALRRIIASGTFALPTFGSDDGLFPGTARRGRLEGPLADDEDVRFTLAVLYSALLSAACIRDLPPAGTVVLDGNFVVDPLYGAIVTALLPDRRVLVSRSTTGTATGAAMLAAHEERISPVPLAAEAPDISDLPDLSSHQRRWQALAKTMEQTS